MARTIGRLTALKVEREKRPGLYADGGGLYLQVRLGADKRPRKAWIFRYAITKTATTKHGKMRQLERHMGLGPVDQVSLAEARVRAAGARKLREQGLDPIEVRNTARATAAADAAAAQARTTTFDECTRAYITAHEAGWRNAKYAKQWNAMLETYVSPVFGKLAVGDIDTGLVIRALEPIWATKPETASRVRSRIEVILDWARVRGYRSGLNPARWRGHLNYLLPKRSKVRKVKHHPALPYGEMPQFMTAIRAQPGIAARAFEFAILVGARTGEVIGAQWFEIDVAQRIWTVPAERMKTEKEHRVPLCERALAIVAQMQSLRDSGGYVFPGSRRPGLSNMAFLMLLRRMKRGDVTAHGFRSTFRDWAAECTNFPSEVVEMALAHAIESETEAAYRRGDLFNKRRQLMEAWAAYCEGPAADAKVVTLQPKRPNPGQITGKPDSIRTMHVDEAASLLAIEVDTLNHLIAAGRLPQPDCSGGIPAAPVEELLAQTTNGATASEGEIQALTDAAIERILLAAGQTLSLNARDALLRDLNSAIIHWWSNAKLVPTKGQRAKRKNHIMQVRKHAEGLKKALDDDTWLVMWSSAWDAGLDPEDPRPMLHVVSQLANAVRMEASGEWDPEADPLFLFSGMSPFQQLAGVILPKIFRHHFPNERVSYTTKDGLCESAFIRFVQGVLFEMGISNNGVSYANTSIAKAVTKFNKRKKTT
jgi:integrase